MQALRHELKQLRAAMDAIDGTVESFSESDPGGLYAVTAAAAKSTKQFLVSEASKRTLKNSNPESEMTFQDMIVSVLSDLKEPSADASEILHLIAQKFKKYIQRSSLSPQLSRLKAKGVLELNGSIWSLTKRTRERMNAYQAIVQGSAASDLDSVIYGLVGGGSLSGMYAAGGSVSNTVTECAQGNMPSAISEYAHAGGVQSVVSHYASGKILDDTSYCLVTGLANELGVPSSAYESFSRDLISRDSVSSEDCKINKRFPQRHAK